MANTTIYNLPALNTVDSTTVFPVSSNVTSTETTYQASIGNVGNAITGNLRMSGDNLSSTNNLVLIYANIGDQATALTLNDLGDAALWANANVTINSNSQGSNPQWIFDTTGNLTAPGNIIMDSGVDGNIESTGNINLTAIGNVYINSKGHTFNFDSDTVGRLIMPPSGIIASDTNVGNGLNIFIGDTSTEVGNTWNFSANGALTLPSGGLIANIANYGPGLSTGIFDANGATLGTGPGNDITITPSDGVAIYSNGAQWLFGIAGNLTIPGDVNLPLVAKLNSGGIGVTNSAEFGTEVTVDISNVINGSQIYMSAGNAAVAAVVDASGNSLMYFGVEHSYPGAFAGTVALDPGVTSEYAIQVGANNQIEIGAVVGAITTTEYVAGLGVLNATGNINGIFANANVAVIGVGDLGWSFGSDGNLTLPGNLIGNGASPAPSINGFDSANFSGNVNVGTNLFVGDSSANVSINYDGTGNFTGNLTSANANLGNLVTANYANVVTNLFVGDSSANVSINYDGTGNFTGNLTSANANLGDLATANNFSTNGAGGDVTLTSGNIIGANVINSETIIANTEANVRLLTTSNISTVGTSNLDITSNSHIWTFGADGNLTVNGNINLVTNSNLWNFDTNGTLTFPGNTLQAGLISGNSGLSSNTADITINTTNAGGGLWSFGADGNLTVPGTILATSNSNLTLQTDAIYNSTTITAVGTGYTSGSDVSTVSGGFGLGMTVNVNAVGGEVTLVTVVNPGTGYVNGDTITILGGGGDATFTIANYNSAANSAIFAWAFGADGNLTLPDNSLIKIAGSASGIYSAGDVDFSINLNGKNWSFDAGSAIFTLPDGGAITEGGIPLYTSLSGNTIILTPSGGTSATQQLLVYPTAVPDANHLHLTSGNLYETELFLGDDNLYVKLDNTGNVEISSYLLGVGTPATWTFGTDGNLTTPGNIGSGNITGANVIEANTGNFTNTVFIGNSSANVSINYDGTGNFTGNLTSANANLGNLITANYANVVTNLFVGNSSANVSINYDGTGNFTGNLTAAFFLGNGSQLTGIATSGIANGTSNVSIPAIDGNVNVISAGNTTLVVTSTGANITGTGDFTGNLTSANANLGNLVTANYANVGTNLFVGDSSANVSINYDGTGNFTGNLTAANANLGNLVTANYANVLANLFVGNSSANVSINYDGTGNFTGNLTAANANLGNLVTANYANVGTNLFVGDSSANVSINYDGTGNFTGNLTSANANLGNLVTANYANVETNLFVGNSSANVSINYDGTGNFTGNLTSANANLGNLVIANYANVGTNLFVGDSSANVSINYDGTGNFTGNLTSANANLGNLVLANYVNVTANITSGNANLGNLVLANYVNVTANITSGNANLGNLVLANYVNVTANINGANVITANTFTSLGNVQLLSNGNIWIFDTAGTLTLPNLGLVNNNPFVYSGGVNIQVSDLAYATFPSGGGLTGSTYTQSGWEPIVFTDTVLYSAIRVLTGAVSNGTYPIVWSVDSTSLSGYVYLEYSGTPNEFSFCPVTDSTGANPVIGGSWNFPAILDVTVDTPANVTISAVGPGTAVWSFASDGIIQVPITTVASLPAATTPGLKAFVNDSNSVPVGNFGVVVTTGGSNYTPVFSDGTNWLIG